MVNDDFTRRSDVVTPDRPERALALAYAPAGRRAGLAALFAFDDRLADILRTTREPMVGQMRLTWWHDAVGALGDSSPPAEPVLAALAAEVVPRRGGAALARIVEGWEELLAPDPLPDVALTAFAEGRGGGLFAAAAMILGADARDPVAPAGAIWALGDLAAHVGDPALAARARAAMPVLPAIRWSRAGRPLGALAHLALCADAHPARRVGRALWHRATGL